MADIALDPLVRPLVTPEGVDLRVKLAPVSERAMALFIDLAIIVGILIGLMFVTLGALAAMQIEEGQSAAVIVWLLGFFILRNFYFTLFECGTRAATPGKRLMGLRVAARDGGVLSADAVVARNAMRELELYLPISFLVQRGSEIDAWVILAGIIWCGVFVLFPLFNRDKLRGGDLVAGTWVLRAPKPVLLPDLAEAAGGPRALFVFDSTQLSVYGVKELQVLEQVLRTSEPNAIEAVATRIRAKIRWTKRDAEDDHDFLSAYYAALRQHLEHRLLFGRRKRDKHDAT
jgi:uncharacterized RDD family membrane protein YckC